VNAGERLEAGYRNCSEASRSRQGSAGDHAGAPALVVRATDALVDGEVDLALEILLVLEAELAIGPDGGAS
jgi:hypothetical protein